MFSAAVALTKKQSVKTHRNILSLSKNVIRMREAYDFSKSRKNLYIKRLKKQVTMNIDCNTIEYFKDQSEESGIPYQGTAQKE